MKTVRDLMTAEPVTLDEHLTLREAVEALSSARISGAPVVAGSKVVGVVSRADILEFEATSPGVPRRRENAVEFGEVPMDDVTYDEENEPAAYFVERWADSEADVWSRISETESPEWDRLDEHSIGEVMSRKLVALGPGASVREAARLMVERGVHRLIVMEAGELLGILSTMDIVRAVAEGPTG